jgi:16S rRNA processing protein RimM
LNEEHAWLRAGTVGRPHGLDGSFYVGAPVSGLLTPDAVVTVGGERRRIIRLAGHDRRPILRLEGCEQRADAQALGGQEILVARSGAAPLGEDEWWATDLEGCAVRDSEDEVGVVTRLLALPSCEVLEVARHAGGAALLVPLVKDAVREVDLDRRVIEIDLAFLGER